MLFSSLKRGGTSAASCAGRGLGIQTVEDMLAGIIVDEGFCVFDPGSTCPASGAGTTPPSSG